MVTDIIFTRARKNVQQHKCVRVRAKVRRIIVGLVAPQLHGAVEGVHRVEGGTVPGVLSGACPLEGVPCEGEGPSLAVSAWEGLLVEGSLVVASFPLAASFLCVI